MDNRVYNLMEKIFFNHLSEFQFKLNEVISMGESPIEKLMILQLFHYFQKYDSKYFDEPDFYNLEFIEEDICLVDFEEPLSYFETEKLEDKVNRFNYRFKNGVYEKYVGFKCSINKPFVLFGNKDSNKECFNEIEIRPQYYHLDVNNFYKIDIAIFLRKTNWFTDNKVIEERKIAIECDGYDYHSSPTQKRNDDIRVRKLKRAGWKDVLRYSGSEIFYIDDNLQLIHKNFEEIMDIIML